MIIPLTEPIAPRYIYINPETNQVHLLVAVVGGQTISTDNTCKTTMASDEFFSGAALRELNAYKAALEFDLQLLGNDNIELSTSKQQRLEQINAYIAAIPAMQTIGGGYRNAITALKQIPSNLYSIKLRPREQDPVSNIVNPMFTINRTNDATGKPLSALYNALHTAFPYAAIAPLNPRQRLETAVMAELVAQPVNFETTQRVLTEQCHRLFGLTVDFTHDNSGAAVNQASLDTLMGFTPDNPATTDEYMAALLGACALNIWDNIATSPFYSGHDNPTTQTEKLSIMTQFFLAHVNIHCAENTISPANFGAILDASSELSDEVAGIVVSTLGTGADVEESLCTFFNEHLAEFGFIRALSPADTGAIKQRFITNYATVKDLEEMDEFMILNTATDTGNFVTHQGAICTDFSELAVNNPLDNAFFQAMRADFEAPKGRYIPHRNEQITASIDVDIEELLSRITDDEQLKLLDVITRHQLNMSPIFQSRLFLPCVAKGQQDEAQRQIEANPALLLTTGRFTDYSGRTFNCTAYEYAYWAKDTHMCRMLERHMDENTKAAMLEKVIAIDSVGLTYEQHGHVVEHSTHFDMTPLITALKYYVDGYDAWGVDDNTDAMIAAWMAVGKAQCDLPVHVINEYCRLDRSFHPLPGFDVNESKLPRVTAYYNSNGLMVSLYPLVVSDSVGLGGDFALIRGPEVWAGDGPSAGWGACDLAAVSHLDEVRTADLTLSRTNLGLIEPELDHGARLSL